MPCSFRSVGLALIIVTEICIVTDRPVQAETTDSEADIRSGTPPFDCTTIAVDYQDDPFLTRAEKLARMDEAFSRSLEEFDACRAVSSPAAVSTSVAAGQVAPEADATLGGDPVRAVASSEIAGTEAPAARSESAPSTLPTAGDIPVAKTVVGREQGILLPNGRGPEDIPAADNDSILAAQIRQAAMREADPEKQKRLWEEYRRYKDRAVQEKDETP